MRIGCGRVEGRVEASLLLDLFTIAVLFAMLARSHFKSEEVHDRLDDVIDGVGLFAQEVLARTQDLREWAERAAPAIELHNHTPLEQIFSFISNMRNGNFDAENITRRRDPHGQYAPALEEIESTETPPEIIDLTD